MITEFKEKIFGESGLSGNLPAMEKGFKNLKRNVSSKKFRQ